jgi:NitT/TauT family transport system permease protein
MLRIGGRITTPQFLGLAVTVFAGLLVLWVLATRYEWVKPIFLPSPDKVWNRLIDLARGGELWDDTRISVYRIAVGFALATVMAIPIGLLIGAYRFWEAAIEPLVDFIRYMPVVAFVPLTILWAGTGDSQKFLIIWIGTFFQQVLLIMDNTKRVPLDLVDIGRTLGMKDRSILARIILRGAAPGIWDSMRISLGWAWTWLVLAELVAATSGLGYRITTAQRFFQTDTIIGYILVLGFLGLVTDQVMKFLGRRMFSYAEARR